MKMIVDLLEKGLVVWVYIMLEQKPTLKIFLLKLIK